MDKAIKQRIAFALQCKLEEVPESQEGIKDALNKRRAKMKAEKEAKHG